MTVERSTDNHSRSLNILVLGLAFVWIIVVVTKFFSLGLFLDETVSYWLIEAGPTKVIARVLQYHAQSPLYYLVLASVAKVCGSSEIVLRLPSLIALGLAFYVFFLIGQKISDRNSAVIAVIFFASADPIVKTLGARPYAFALLFCLLAILALIHWLESASNKLGLYYVLCTALIFYFHYLFALTIAIHGAIVLLSRNRRLAIRRYLLGLLSVGLLCIPGCLQLASIAAKQTKLSFVAVPNLVDLVAAVLAPVQMIYFGFIVVFMWVTGAKLRWFEPKRLTNIDYLGLLCWWLIGPVFFYLYSIFAVPLFVDRYFLWSLGGFSILLGVILASIFEPKAQKLVAVILLSVACIRELDRRWIQDGWREVSQQVSNLPDLKSDNVFIYSGLIETQDPVFYQSEERLSYLAAPFSFYPLSVSARPIAESWPVLSKGAELPQVVKQSIGQNGLAYLVSYRTHLRPTQPDLASQIGSFKVEPIGQYGQVDLLSIKQARQD